MEGSPTPVAPPPLLAPELAERLEALFVALGLTMPGGAEGFAQAALKRGIGLVDPSRQSALVDLTVYAGACWRLNRMREEVETQATRIVGLEAMLCDAQAEIETLRGGRKDT